RIRNVRWRARYGISLFAVPLRPTLTERRRCSDSAQEDPAMDKDLKEQASGKGQNIKGRVKEAFGAVTGDKSTEAEGVADRFAGAAREKVAEVKRDLTKPDRRTEEAVDERHG